MMHYAYLKVYAVFEPVVPVALAVFFHTGTRTGGKEQYQEGQPPSVVFHMPVGWDKPDIGF